MPEICLLTSSREGISPVKFARDVQHILDARGYQTILSQSLSNTAALHHNYVVNFEEHMTPDVLKLNRYIHMQALVVIHTDNLENFSEPGWASLVAWFMKNRANGVPYRLISISPYQYEQMVQRVHKTFSRTIGRKILGNIRNRPYGCLNEFQSGGKNNRQLFIVPFNRLRSQKNPGLHSKVTACVKLALAAKGQKTTHVFRYAENYGPEGRPDHGLDLSCYHMQQQAESREAYIREVKNYGIAISTAKYESFGLYYIELMAAGVVMVFLDKQWNRSLFPGYRYRSNADDLAALTMYVYEHYEEAQEYYLQVVIPYIDEHYRLERFVDGMLEDFGPGVEECRL